MFIIILHQLRTLAISAYSGLSHLENYVCVVAIEPELQSVSSHGVTDFLHHSINAKLLPLYTCRRVLSKPQNLATMMASHCQPYMRCGAQIHAESQRLSVRLTEAITDLG